MKAKKIITTLLATTLLITALSVPVSADEKSDKEAFVTRLYEQCLDREPEKAGFDYWMEALNNNTESGASIAYNFVFSPEFQSKQFSNEDYIEHMYALVLGRTSEPAGKAYWVDKMNNGSSRTDIFNGFVRSDEFDGLCKSYGIETSSWQAGDYFTKRQFVDCFVQRMYVTCLGRNYDISGLCYWSDLLYWGGVSGSSAAYDFFFSPEYVNSNKSDEDYVKDLYKAMMGRGYDEQGLKYWLDILASGTSRAEVFDGFASSNEFTDICNEYWILRGEVNHSPQAGQPFDPNAPHTMEQWMAYQGISAYTSTDGKAIYGKFVDTTELNLAVNSYRESLGLPPYVVGTDNSKCMQGAIDSYSIDAPYCHEGVNNLSYHHVQDGQAYKSFYESDGHRACWESGLYGEYGLVYYTYLDGSKVLSNQRYYVVMTSACFERYVWLGEWGGFMCVDDITTQNFDHVYYTVN